MTIRTAPGPIVIDSGDFQLTHQGVTVGLKLTYIQGPMGPIASVSVAEKVGADWVEKDVLMPDFGVEYLKTKGVAAWLSEMLIPKVNAWLAKRFAKTPAGVPDWVPQVIVDLDGAMLRLKVTTDSGVPVVS